MKPEICSCTDNTIGYSVPSSSNSEYSFLRFLPLPLYLHTSLSPTSSFPLPSSPLNFPNFPSLSRIFSSRKQQRVREMKFGKSLSNQIEETLPEWRDKFLSYKDLKRQLKLIDPIKAGNRLNKRQKFVSGDCKDGDGDKEMLTMTREEINFIQLLEEELEKFNNFFVEQEEEYIIRLKELQDRVAKANKYSDEMIKIRKEIVDFHGEMVLLENYSALNYTGLVKILKKYDKRTGALIRLPFIQRVLQQPFFTTDLLYTLVKGCEKLLDQLFPVDVGYGPTTSTLIENDGLIGGTKELAEIEYMESLHMKSTISALRVLKEIRSQSSTVSIFSLPPLLIKGAR